MLDGILGRKVSMDRRFTEDGQALAVTAIEAGPCTVTQVRTVERDGYTAVQVGFGAARRLNRAELGHLGGRGSFRYLREFRVPDAGVAEVGETLDVGIFQPGDKVDITGTSKGKGFAGGVKRHHFHGGPKTHGQ